MRNSWRKAGWAILAGVVVAACAAAQPDRTLQPDRIVVVGDVHGDFSQFAGVLRSAGVIDARNKWSGGRTHLVQIGDIPDRGPDTKKIIAYLMDLEKQARRAQGMVHLLIGNHEAMNIYGDLRYVIAKEFEAFASRDGEYRALAWEMFEAEAKAKDVKLSSEDRKKWNAERPKGFFEHRIAFGPGGKFYKWIVGHDAVLRLGDTLFVHAGISPKYAGEDQETLNRRVRDELTDFSKLSGGAVMDADGPLWYRGLATGDETELAEHVDAVLARHGVRRIVIGHTPMPGAVIPRFGGKVIAADVGLSKAYGGAMACVLIEKDSLSAIHRGKRLPLPQGGTAELLAYLKEAAALDPAPSPLTEMISKIEASLTP
ncbi:MAG: metallophosphoesterase [Bryobacteraceae bacterium]|nr:metallophosphoesterase [Bryobacteraceae bacterium]